MVNHPNKLIDALKVPSANKPLPEVALYRHMQLLLLLLIQLCFSDCVLNLREELLTNFQSVDELGRREFLYGAVVTEVSGDREFEVVLWL